METAPEGDPQGLPRGCLLLASVGKLTLAEGAHMLNKTKIIIHHEDLPSEIAHSLGSEVAVDTETMGLNIRRDRLCLIQLKAKESREVHLVQFSGINYNAPNLAAIFSNKAITKVYHYARFDIAVILYYLKVTSENNFCTKIASALARTYSPRHGLKELTQELLGVNLSKQQQSSNWGSPKLSTEQKHYAANDVLYLSDLKEKLTTMLEQGGRYLLAQACFSFLTTRCMLDLNGWENTDIFSHNFNL